MKQEINSKCVDLCKFYITEGVSTYYYEDGKIKEKGNYLKGEQTGLWTSYYPNGKIKEETNYQNDVKNGKSKEFNEKGKLTKEYTYKDGK